MRKMTNQKVGVIVQARMGSTRLPGKVLKSLNDKETVLDLLIKRLKLSTQTNEIIIATTPDNKNKQILEKIKPYNISSFIGDEANVLERYYLAAKKHSLDIVIRVTSDCPFVDPRILDDMIIFYKNHDYDYIRNVDKDTNFVNGFEIEICSFKVLEKTYNSAETVPEKEHVTLYIYRHPEIFSIYSYNVENLKKFNDLRLTIDEIDDLTIIRTVYKKLIENGKSYNFSVYDVLDVIEKNPEYMNINKHVQQKKV